MSEYPNCYNVFFEEKQDDSSELRFDMKAANYSGDAQQQTLVDSDVGNSLVVLGT